MIIYTDVNLGINSIKTGGNLNSAIKDENF